MSPDPSKLSTINQVIGMLSSAQLDLQNAADATADPDTLDKINAIYKVVQSCMDQAAQAQAAADDALFEQATSALKTQAKMLEGMEAQIKSIISDVALAGRIVGYIAQAIALVAKL
jgi:hypothetical protein